MSLKLFRNKISNYELMYNRFIGHDGNGQIASCGFNSDTNRFRASVEQHSYLVNECIIAWN